MNEREGRNRNECPPRWAEWLVARGIPYGMRGEILTDLSERFAEVTRERGRGAALRWYRGQLLRLAPKILAAGLRGIKHVFSGEGTLVGIISDIRFAIRNFIRRPMFAAVAIITLMLGIGANTAIFSVVDGILLRPLPYPAADRLVTVWADYTERNGPLREWLSYPNYADMRDSGVFEELSVYGGFFPTLTGRGPARQVQASSISEGMFSRVLRAPTYLGRHFLAEEDVPNGPPVVLISYSFWQSEFSGDPDVVGTAITLDGTPQTIVGVMQQGFRPPFSPGADMWIPMSVDETVAPTRASANFRTVGRLADGIDLATAQQRMTELAGRLEADYPEANEDVGIAVFGLHADMVRDAQTGLWLLLGAVVVVLLIASVNVANLMLARTLSRRPEIAVRAAIGAGAGRIVRQLLTEGAVLAAVGGALGVLVARWGVRFLVAIAPEGTPLIDQVTLDARVLAFAALSTVAVSVLFGLVPAVGVMRGQLHDHLRAGRTVDGDRQGQRTGKFLVAGQIGLTLALLVGSGLLIQTLAGLRAVDSGFDPEGRVAFRFFLTPNSYDRDGSRDFLIRLEDRLALIPGVTGVGSVSALPLSGRDSDVDFVVEGDPVPEVGERRTVWYRGATPGYFDAMGIRIIAGRGFRDSDDQEAPQVVVINEEMARLYFGDRNPIGMRVSAGSVDEPDWREIVGVAEDVKNFGIRNDSRYAVYIPHRQIPFRSMNVVLHTERAEALSLVPDIRNAMNDLDPTVAAAGIQTMTDALELSFGNDRFVTILLGVFSALSLLLSMVGLYGVVSYSVDRRQREMGVRIAVGASSREIRGLVVGSTLRLVATGAVGGFVVSILGVRYIKSMLFGVESFDPTSFGSAAVILALVSVLAALIPAVRASKVDPVTVLKAE